jgi:hypothetical protein
MARAPGLQPEDTGPATTRDHSGGMARCPKRDVSDGDEPSTEHLPTLKAGREVGWIFKNGEAVAIERHGCDGRGNEEAN